MVGGEGEGEEYLFKIVIVGDSSVGKSNLLSRFCRGEFDAHSRATVGVEFQTRCVEVGDGREVKAQLWDTAGQERFRAVTASYYRGAVGAVFVYDITRRESFDNVPRWLHELHAYCDTAVARILVGNKCDMESNREVSMEEGQRLAESKDLFFMETSALNTINVDRAFQVVIQEIYSNIKRKSLNSDSYKAQISSNRITLAGNGDDLLKQNQRLFACCS